MKDKRIPDTIKWLIVINVLITLVLKVRMLRIFFSLNSDVLSYVVVSVFFICSIASIIGLIRKKPWGFISIYVLAPVSLYYLGISLSPFVLFFPYSSRSMAALILNAIILVAAIWLHRQNNMRLES